MGLKSNLESLLLDLAVSIGSKTGVELFSQTIPLFAEKLNCSGAMVLKCFGPNVQEVASTGVDAEEKKLLVDQAISLFSELSSNTPYKVIASESNSFHVFMLLDFGLLSLSFNETPSEDFLKQLQPVINMFAHSCAVSEKLSNSCRIPDHLCQDRSLLEAVIQNIPDPLYVKDIKGRKILVNKAEADLLGVADIADVLGKTDADFYSPEVARKTEAEDKMIFETGNSVIHRDGVLTTSNGKEIWVQGTKMPHFDKDGKVDGIIGISYNISGYKKIESELRDVAEKYQAIFNSFVDLYYRSDLSGTILELSPSVYPLSGYRAEELLGKSVDKVYADIESRNRMIKLLVEKGSINDYENLLVHKSGKLVPVSITSHLFMGSEGKPGYIEGTIRDITERKEAEDKMSKLMNLQNLLTHLATEFINIPIENSDEAVDRLLSVIGNGNEVDRVYIFEYDHNKQTASNTHEWCNVGISPEIENLQNIPLNLIADWLETHRRGEMLMVDDVSKLDPESSLYHILEPQGIQTLVTIPLMLNNECIGFVGFDSVTKVKIWTNEEITFLQVLADLLCNVTDRKRTDEALRNREASLKAIFNNVPFQMWLKDKDSKYLAVNKPFMDYFSLTDDSEVLGKDALDIWDNDAARHFIEQDQKVMESLEMHSVEELIDFKHKTVWFEIFRAPIVDEYGQILGTTGIARDITNRKNADKALQAAVEAAESANEAKSKFLAIMSHEIRNPLNAVVGMVRMLHNASIAAPNDKLVENIKTSSDHLLMIINDILDFSKIESGEMLLEETDFSISEVIGRVYNSHIFIAKDKNIGLNQFVDPKIDSLQKGDPLRLQQVISNLTSNALKFTPTGKIDIRCLLEKETDNKITVRIEVEDTGIGISPENQGKVFESFKQENDTIARTHGGSGLGLAISKQIVELMGGKLELSSSPGVGSKFYFSIELPVSAKPKTVTPEKPKDVENSLLKGYSVLLVEDNKLNQILATSMLEKWGTKVVVAGNGQQAIDVLENKTFDIILMDIQMPIMDGMTASKIIREKLKITTPILALSANVIKGIVERCEEAGMQGYISKPFDSDDLYKKIAMHISNSKTHDTADSIENDGIMVADVSRLEKMIGSDAAQLHKMISKFLEITPTYVKELNNGSATLSHEAIASASHKIKSSIDLVSSQLMRDLILKINLDSRKGEDINQIASLIIKFNAYYKILETQLQNEVNAMSAV